MEYFKVHFEKKYARIHTVCWNRQSTLQVKTFTTGHVHPPHHDNLAHQHLLDDQLLPRGNPGAVGARPGVQFNRHLEFKAWVKAQVKDAFRKAPDREPEAVKAWVKTWVKTVKNVY